MKNYNVFHITSWKYRWVSRKSILLLVNMLERNEHELIEKGGRSVLIEKYRNICLIMHLTISILEFID